MSISSTSDNSIELYINSEVDKRPSDTPANFTVNYPQNIPLPQMNYHLNVVSVAVPNTMPQFNSDQRNVSIQVNNDPAVGFSINKNEVFNSTNEFCTRFEGLVNGISSGLVTVTQDALTRRFTIKNNKTGTIKFSSGGDYAGFWLKLGFSQAQINSGTITIGPHATVASEFLPVLVSTQRVYITCDEIANNSFIPSNETNPPILCHVDLQGAFGSFNVFESDDPNFWNHDLNISGNLNNLSFRLLDDRYKPVELLGSGIRLSLVVKGYKKANSLPRNGAFY